MSVAVARVRLASVPEERFAARIAELSSSIDQLSAEAVRAILAQLDATRREVLAAIVNAEGYSLVRLTQLEASLRDVMIRFVERYQAVLGPAQATMYDAGAALAARPAVDAGLAFHVPQLARRPLEVAQAYQASLIRGVAADAIARISQAIRLGVMNQRSMLEIAGDVAGSLDGPATFSSIATRAEAITRTELGRIQAIATQASLEDQQRAVPDLKKQWQHSGNTGPYRRLGHIEAHDQIRAVSDRFRVRSAPGLPFELLLYPRDPGASPKNSIMCGCLTVPYREAWSLEVPQLEVQHGPRWQEWNEDPKFLSTAEIARRRAWAEAPAGPARAAQTLERFETSLSQAQQRRGLERAAVIAPNGDVLISREGAPDSVPFTRAELELFRGALVTHNHPRGTSLSVPDIMLALRGRAQEIRAVGHAYGYSMRPVGPWPAQDLLQIWIDLAQAEVRSLNEYAISRAVDPDAMIKRASFAHMHEVWTRVVEASNGALRYERFVIDPGKLAATLRSPFEDWRINEATMKDHEKRKFTGMDDSLSEPHYQRDGSSRPLDWKAIYDSLPEALEDEPPARPADDEDNA